MVQTKHLHLHLGLPYFAGDQLAKSLVAARNLLGPDIRIPDPASYRTGIAGLYSSGVPCLTRPLQTLLSSEKRILILSFLDVLGPWESMFDQGVIHHDLPEFTNFMKALFPDREVTLFLTAANPGTVMSSCLSGAGWRRDPAKMAGLRPLWSELCEDLRETHPETGVILYTKEDTPVTWPIILRRILDAPRGTLAPGALQMAVAILPPPSRKLLADTLRQQKITSEQELLGLLLKFLPSHTSQETIEQAVCLPGWTQATVDEFQRVYEKDIEACLDIPGIEVITIEDAIT